MPDQSRTPFASIEGAHEYVSLLCDAVADARQSINNDFAAPADGDARQVEALRVVDYKLNQLEIHLKASSRLLNDLRTLRRLLLGS